MSRRPLLPLTAWFLAALCTVSADNVDLPRYPSVSPDGTQIVFSWRGDLWRVSSQGGEAIRLTHRPGIDTRSVWSRDGKRIFFESTRSGFSNLHVIDADGANPRQLSRTDGRELLWSVGKGPDGAEIVTFSTSREGDNYRSTRPYYIAEAGGDLIRLHDAFGDAPALSPDDRWLAFERGGAAWSRRHYRGADQRDLWLQDRNSGAFRRLTDWAGNDGRPRWGGSESLYFLSDRSHDRYNLYRLRPTASDPEVEPVTRFRDRDIWDFDVSLDGRTAVLQVWDRLEVLDLTNSRANPRPLTIRASEVGPHEEVLQSVERRVSEAALNPDGKTLAYVAHGEVFVRGVEDRSQPRRVTRNSAREREIAWSPDGLTLYFTSDLNGSLSIHRAQVALTRSEVIAQARPAPAEAAAPGDPATASTAAVEPTGSPATAESTVPAAEAKPNDKPEAKGTQDSARWQEALQFQIEPLLERPTDDWLPSPSPDGKRLAFLHERGDLCVMDLETREIRTLLSGWDWQTHWRWSPDSRHLAVARRDLNFNSDIWIVAVEGDPNPVNITRHPDNDYEPRWSADGKILGFLSDRVADEADVWSVFLDRSLEGSNPQELAEYFDRTAKKAKERKPMRPGAPVPAGTPAFALADLDDAYLRLRRITTLRGPERNYELAPGGDFHYFTAVTDKGGLFSVKWDGSDLTRLGDPVSLQHLSLSGEELVFIHQNQAGTIKNSGRDRKIVGLNETIRIDLQQEARQKFRELGNTLGKLFYHPTMKGLDWPDLVRKYGELAERTRTADEFIYVGMRLLGELNGSHLGITDRDELEPNTQSQGRLGTVHRRVADGFEIQSVLPLSPAVRATIPLVPGDVIVAIEGSGFGNLDTVESLLEGRVAKETVVSIRRPGDAGAPEREFPVLLIPVNAMEEGRLKYEAWRSENARLVSEWSGGRLGYIHIRGMDQPSLDVFERDLFAAAEGKQGLVIDVRNNGGGWTTDRLLSSIMVQPHAYTVPRGAPSASADAYPQDRLFIQRYTLPINLVCNEKSFSNAEIISHAFKTLKRGTLVGAPTNGSVISTGAFSLVDGTVVRLPFRGWYLPDGTDMENNGAVPDLLVDQTPEDEAAGQDRQLRRAVEDLLERL